MTSTATTPATTTSTFGALIRTGLLATVAASAATMAVAAVGDATGISLDVADAPIPVTGPVEVRPFDDLSQA
ncbi:DUF6069 family protein [Micromonospora zamorensis]|uniref:DUF6069 family protein n=1 Tax=Micromonospora zamorensis TaxID=709883 RepID=UPI0036C7B8CF